MSWDPPTYDETEVKKPVKRAIWRKVIDCLAYLYGIIGALYSAGIMNGSGEVSSDGTNPDNVAVNEYLGGTFTLSASNSRHGAKCFKFNHPGGSGNGGGDLLFDYTPVTPDRGYAIDWGHWATNGAVHITILVKYYDASKVDLVADQTLFDASSGIKTTAGYRFGEYLSVPSGARYYRLKAILGATDTNPGSSTDIYLDDVRPTSRRAYSAGDYLLAAADTLRENTVNYSSATLKEIRIVRGGTLRITYDYLGSAFDWGQVYRKRGGSSVAVGEQQTSTSSYSEDIPGWQPGDLVQFVVHFDSGAPYPSVANFRIKAAMETVEYVVTD